MPSDGFSCSFTAAGKTRAAIWLVLFVVRREVRQVGRVIIRDCGSSRLSPFFFISMLRAVDLLLLYSACTPHVILMLYLVQVSSCPHSFYALTYKHACILHLLSLPSISPSPHFDLRNAS